MKKFDGLNRLLNYMENNIDLSHLAEIEQLQYDVIHYNNVERLPLTIRTVHDGFKQVPYVEAFNDPEKMLYNEILCSTIHSSYNSVRLKDDGPLMIRSDHGVGIIASLFGCRTFVSTRKIPRVEQISMDEAKRRFDKGVPELNQALGKRVVDTYKYYHERLKAYPRCYKGIRITQPDLQGPYDIFHLILGNDAFILPFHDFEAARVMINVIAETYIAFRRFIDPYLTDKINDDTVFVNGLCVRGKVLVKADTGIANLSPELYQDYEGDPDMKIMCAFAKDGGGSLQYYGGSKKWHNSRIYNEHLGSVHYGNPEMHDIKSEYAYFKNKKVAIVGWGYNQGYTFAKKTMQTGNANTPIMTGLTLVCEAKDVKHGREILSRHKELCFANRKSDTFIPL